MENKTINKDEYSTHLSFLKNKSSSGSKTNFEINDNYENSFLFTNEHLLSESKFYKNEDLNIISDSISKDILNLRKEDTLTKKRKNSEGKKENHLLKKKYSNNYLIRRAKKILFDSLLKFDNEVISKVYDSNIGNGINIKKLLKINHYNIQNTNTVFNKKLLNAPQKLIFSSDISTRFTNYPLNHNKILISKLLNEKNDDKRKIFNDLFSRTLSECINYLIGKRKFKSLEGLDKFYENEIIELDEDQSFKELLKKIINDLNNIFEKKKPRRVKLNK